MSTSRVTPRGTRKSPSISSFVLRQLESLTISTIRRREVERASSSTFSSSRSQSSSSPQRQLILSSASIVSISAPSTRISPTDRSRRTACSASRAKERLISRALSPAQAAGASIAAATSRMTKRLIADPPTWGRGARRAALRPSCPGRRAGLHIHLLPLLTSRWAGGFEDRVASTGPPRPAAASRSGEGREICWPAAWRSATVVGRPRPKSPRPTRPETETCPAPSFSACSGVTRARARSST